MPTTRSQQQASGTPLNMSDNPPTPISARAVDILDRPEDRPAAAEHPATSEVPAVSVLTAIQRSLDRISERLDDFDGRLLKVEGHEASAEASRLEGDADVSSAPVASSQPQHSTPSAPSNVLPPHMTRPKATPSPTAKDPPRAREVFRSLSTPHKDVFRMVLDRMGTNVFDFLEEVPDEVVSEQIVSSAVVGDAADPGRAVVESTESSLPSLAPPRIRVCKPEYLPEYGGDPYKLDKFLTRVHDIIRNDPDPAWERAVLYALPIKLVHDAEEWHSGLSTAEVKSITRFDDLEAAMRIQFPMNRAEQRRLARERKWQPTEENAGTYYFAKLRVLRSAFGKDQTDAVLAQDIVDGLPATCRALIRLPRSNVRLSDLRAEIGDWEPTWRELHPQLARRSASSSQAAPPGSTSSPAKAAPTKQPASAGPPPSAAAAGTGGTSRPLPLAATYDPARVIPAADGKPRRYRRPGDDVVIELNRPCARCGQDHFGFEHQHLIPAVRVMEGDDNTYPEVEGETAGSLSF
ncbi:hypothetical protein A4X13_0g8404 [Tilletia indica]|uniref:Retrotransposon gag domain-containing protein n=1 Tax=Tilletia indica TaxID=43049 RepID=A0A177TE97_9BASI|nr:hypothetical protein A4X13_0g8404 [Tilletia indica]